jgi:transcription elongation factor Elf1
MWLDNMPRKQEIIVEPYTAEPYYECIGCGKHNATLVDTQEFTGGRTTRVYVCRECGVMFGVSTFQGHNEVITDRLSRNNLLDDTIRRVQELEIVRLNAIIESKNKIIADLSEKVTVDKSQSSFLTVRTVTMKDRFQMLDI